MTTTFPANRVIQGSDSMSTAAFAAASSGVVVCTGSALMRLSLLADPDVLRGSGDLGRHPARRRPGTACRSGTPDPRTGSRGVGRVLVHVVVREVVRPDRR